MARTIERRAVPDSRIGDTEGWIREVNEFRMELITVAFFNRNFVWFTACGKRYRYRLRELLGTGEEVGLLIAQLEARGVQFEITDDGDLHFWVTDSSRDQIRFRFNRDRDESCCCRGLRLERTGHNSWRPHLYS